ncbi:hypothetical protein AVEN_2171-1 [Araneus ventricosus]|uniref:Uncharacterized protein n=1 Tax=Araneus ventricosus TaxID=182803 RepID=A0A4Y2IHS9_ARAVE|nr:hypothetical protein AVEN_2171-1 [Araneus ventricosus]
MTRHYENTFRDIVKCHANSTSTAIIAVRKVKPFQVDRKRAMLKEEDNILSNPVREDVNFFSQRGYYTEHSDVSSAITLCYYSYDQWRSFTL